MWSLGVILYILLSGCPPFDPGNENEFSLKCLTFLLICKAVLYSYLTLFSARKDKPLVKQICQGDYKFPSSKWSEISESAVDLVRKLMTVDSKKRLSAEEVRSHEFRKFKKFLDL